MLYQRRKLPVSAKVLLVTTVLLGGIVSAQQSGGTLTAAIGYDIDTLNVYSTGYLGDAEAAVAEGLLAPNSKAQYVPVLAKQVPTLKNGGIKLEPGNKMTITYHLRPGVKWSDGQPFTSSDVRFTWEAVKDPKFIAESKDGSGDVDSIDTPDALTAVVHYKRVSPDFASTLFTFGILPEHTLKGKDLNTDNYNNAPLGTGPFKVTEFKRGQYVILDRNPFYWRKDAKGAQLPYLDRIIIKIIPDANTQVTQVKSGEVQFAYNVPYSQAASLQSVPGIKLIKNDVLSWQHLDFNFRNDLLKDIVVRKAIAHAIDKDAVSKALGGFPKPIVTPVVPVFSFSNKNVPKYAFSVETAGSLLDAAGYKLGADGVRAKAGKRLSFKIMAQSGRTNDEIAEQVIIANLKAIGIEVVTDNKAGVALRDARYKGGYDLYFGGWITSADPVYSVFYGTGGANNGQGYSNPALDAVFATAESTLDPAKRRAALFQFQNIVMRDVVTVPVTTNVSLIAVTDKLTNFKPNPTNMTNFVDTSAWYLKK